MSNLFEDVDYDTVQLLYGFILVALAVVLATTLVGNVYALTAVVCLLLLKDGFPNLVIGFKKIAEKKDKDVLGKPGGQ